MDFPLFFVGFLCYSARGAPMVLLDFLVILLGAPQGGFPGYLAGVPQGVD